MQRQSMEETKQTKGRAHALGTVVGTGAAPGHCPPVQANGGDGANGWPQRLRALFKRELLLLLLPLCCCGDSEWCECCETWVTAAAAAAAAPEAAARARLLLQHAAALLPS